MPVTRTSLVSPDTPDPTPQVPYLTWTSPDGNLEITLSDPGGPWGVTTLPGATGFGMPEFTYYETASPSFDGSTVRGVRAESREINLPLVLWGANRAQCLENFHGVVGAMNPRNGPGTLTLTTPDGNARSIFAYYNGGLVGKDDDAEWGMTHMSAVIVLKCPSPYFLGTPTSQTLRTAYGDTFFPLLPVGLVSSQILGNSTLVNDGDAEAFPVYTIVGPVTNPQIINSTTGTQITLNTSLTLGQEVTIDTREGAKTVLRSDGANLYPYLATGSALGALDPGANDMTFNMQGATTDTSVTVTFQKRYLTAY